MFQADADPPFREAMSKRLLLVLLFVVPALACGSSSGDSSTSETSTATTSAIGTVKGTVYYAGAQHGAVRLALFPGRPDTGQPPVAAAHIPSATFPLAYSMEAPAGSYQLYTFLDVADDSYVPSSGDPVATPDQH